MSKRKRDEAIQLRVTTPFIHRGQRVLVGDVIECNSEEAEGALSLGWAARLVNGDGAGRHERRDMRAKS
jgi:hypothetical protein